MKRHLLSTVWASVLCFCSATSGQVKLVSPEEGRRAADSLAAPETKPAAARSLRSGAPPAATSILPARFAAWAGGPLEAFGAYSASTMAGADAPVLVEYGFSGGERRRYTRGPQALDVEALRFRDSFGSYGLYTFYRGEDWETKDTGREQWAFRGAELLLRKEDVVLRVKSAADGRLPADADIRALAAAIAATGGGPLPNLPRFLPDNGLLMKSRKYIMGPTAFARLAPHLPGTLVDFDMGAEAVLASYGKAGTAPMTMLLLSYPTPQIAGTKLRSWQQLPPSGGDQPGSVLYARRKGPLVAFVSGAQSQGAADALLNRITYSLEVMWNERVDKTRAPTPAEFMLNLVKLIGALLLFALVAGLGFGLFRALVQARYPHQVFDRPGETEIIRLNIRYSRLKT